MKGHDDRKESVVNLTSLISEKMIFSCTQKVRDKIKKYHQVENVKEEIGINNWYVDSLILERKNYFLFTNSQTLFSFFLYAGTKSEIQQIVKLFTDRLAKQINIEIGSPDKYISSLLSEAKTPRFMKTNSRSVLGSMTDLKNQIETQLWYRGELAHTYERINRLINQVPMSAIQYQYSVTKMKEELEHLEQGEGKP